MAMAAATHARIVALLLFACASLPPAVRTQVVKGCQAGTHWHPSPATAPEESCQPCKEGFYCPGAPYGEYPELPVNLNRRVACPVGSFLNVTGASSLSQCLACERGRYQDWYGQTVCLACLAGTYVDANGSTSVHDCVGCPCGHFCPEGSPQPTPCSPGTYTRNERMLDATSCLPCPPGTACPTASCDPRGCAECPAGKFGNASGIEAEGPGGAACELESDFCTPCPSSFFCPPGSSVPTSCPPGTTSAEGTEAEGDCQDCPVGHRCQLSVNLSVEQSLVYREANGEQIVGSVVPEPCAVDATVIHFSYPEEAGCVELCPYNLSRQSFCHVAGDGRPPDRGRLALRVGELIARRGQHALSSVEEQDWALGNLTDDLDALSAEEQARATSMPDRNGRTPLLLASMLGDVTLLQVLWDRGANGTGEARDAGGFTGLMHALRFDRLAAVDWLVATANSSLAPSDVKTLQELGVSCDGVPTSSLQAAPEYLGRGGLTWVHSSGTEFVDSQLADGPAGFY